MNLSIWKPSFRKSWRVFWISSKENYRIPAYTSLQVEGSNILDFADYCSYYMIVLNLCKIIKQKPGVMWISGPVSPPLEFWKRYPVLELDKNHGILDIYLSLFIRLVIRNNIFVVLSCSGAARVFLLGGGSETRRGLQKNFLGLPPLLWL